MAALARQTADTIVRLRPLAERDKARVLAWRNSPEVAAYMYCDEPIAAEQHERWFAAARVDPARRYWIIEVDGLPSGLANLADISERHRRCSWAYYLAAPEIRGRGVGSAVEFQVIEYVFGQLGFAKLWCEVLETNDAVWRLHERHGFQCEARLRRHVAHGAERLDVLGLGLTAEDWAQRRGAMAARLESKRIVALPVV